MKKIAAACAVVAILVPLGAGAGDVQDGRACRNSSQSGVRTAANGASEADRFSVCVKGPGGETLVYAGGEAQSEDPRNDGFAGTCGAVIVADQTVAQGAYGEDWDRTSYPNGHAKKGTFHC